ncbi:MAG: hypothetical protein WDM94_07485 [Bauldia sp.]
MNTYKVTGVGDAALADRATGSLTIRTNKGDVALQAKAEQLDQLVSALEQLVFTMSRGGASGSGGLMRVEIADGHQIGMATVNNEKIVTLGLGLGDNRVLRWYGLDKAKAEALVRDLTAEIAKL